MLSGLDILLVCKVVMLAWFVGVYWNTNLCRQYGSYVKCGERRGVGSNLRMSDRNISTCSCYLPMASIIR